MDIKPSRHVNVGVLRIVALPILLQQWKARSVPLVTACPQLPVFVAGVILLFLTLLDDLPACCTAWLTKA